MKYGSLKEYEIDIIANAKRFDVAVFLGTGRFARETELPSLDTARERGAAMAKEAANGRPAMIYAVSAEGRSVLVPKTYQPARPAEQPEETAMPATKFTGTEIAKLTAIITGGGYKRTNSKDAAIKRFLNAAKDKGIEKPDTFLAMPSFDDAASALRGKKAPRSVNIEDIHKSNHPTAKANAASWRKENGGPVAVPKGGKRAAILEAAKAGTLPEPPDFSAKTHERFRPKLAKVVELAKAGDIKGLKAMEINPVSSSPKAMARYRDLCVIALESRK